MTIYPSSYVLDNGLTSLDNANKFVVCSQRPTTYTEANSTYALASKTGAVFNAIADQSTNGRQRTMVAIATMSGIAVGTGTVWATLDTVNSRLLVAGTTLAPQFIGLGNNYSAQNGNVSFAL